jgi:hypothetical protein
MLWITDQQSSLDMEPFFARRLKDVSPCRQPASGYTFAAMFVTELSKR